MTNYQTLYKAEYAKKVKENFNLVRQQLKQKDAGLLEKIKKRSLQFSIPESQIIKGIELCDAAVIPFAVSPARQNFYERIAFEMISKMPGISGAENLPNKKLFVCGGAVIDHKDLKTYPSAKTLDFKWTYKGYTVYASHKYTKDSGGAQDNQYKDLQEFIKQCRDSKLKKTIFVAIADGDYYLTQNGRAGVTKIQNLEDSCTKKVIACRMETLQQKLDLICKKS